MCVSWGRHFLVHFDLIRICRLLRPSFFKSFHCVVVSFVWRTFETWESAESVFWIGSSNFRQGNMVVQFIHPRSITQREQDFPIRLYLIESSLARRTRSYHFVPTYTLDFLAISFTIASETYSLQSSVRLTSSLLLLLLLLYITLIRDFLRARVGP